MSSGEWFPIRKTRLDFLDLLRQQRAIAPVRPVIAHKPTPSVPDIVSMVAWFYHVDRRLITGGDRYRYLVRLRWMCFHIANEFGRSSSSLIARYCGGLDHTTVIYGLAQMRVMTANSERLRDEVDLIKRHLLDAIGVTNIGPHHRPRMLRLHPEWMTRKTPRSLIETPHETTNPT